MNSVKFLFILTLMGAGFLLAVPLAQASRSADSTTPATPNDEEKRSSIHEVHGYAYLSEDKTPAQMRTEAFVLAKRQAVEAARTYIQSKTMVENYELNYDRVWSQAEGMVRVLEQKDHGIENNRYHVWIKAEVIYDIKPKKQSADPTALMGRTSPLTVKVWTEKKTYAPGESVIVYIQGNRDFYARVVDITSTGDIVQLLPNQYRSNNFFQAGKVYKIPDTGDRFDLRATPPHGEDRIVVYASEAALRNVSMKPMERGLRSFQGTKEKLDIMSRGIEVVPGSGFGQGAEFYEAQWNFVTMP